MAAFGFLVYWFVEIVVRFAFFGQELWFKPADIYNQLKDRFEVLVSLAGLTLFGLVVVYKRYLNNNLSYFDPSIPLGNLHKDLVSNPTPDNLDWSFDAAGRLCFILPLLRLLSTFAVVSRLFFGLLAILPIFWDVYVVGLIIFYMFCSLGVLLFFGTYSVLLDDANGIPEATFDSMLNSVFVCFNLFNGESWDLLMEAGVNSSGLWCVPSYA